MTDRIASRDAPASTAEANLDAFFRHRDDVPAPCRTALIGSLSRLRGSDDPIVTFAGLPAACVPGFADGCQVELTDGAEPPFRVTHAASSADDPERTAAHTPGSGQLLLTPFRVASRTGYPSYAGLVTHWWIGRAPSDSDAAIADLMVKHLIALVDRERLMVAVACAEDRAASLALEAISGRTINLATGIVMHQDGLAPGEAENQLRKSAREAGLGILQVAASVVRCASLSSAASRNRSGPVARDLVLVDPVADDEMHPVTAGRGPASDGRPRTAGTGRVRPDASAPSPR